MRRRTLLSLPALTGLAAAMPTSALLAGCGAAEEDPPVPQPTEGVRKVAYGDDPSQYAELSLPDGPPQGVVVVVHGGFWKAEYDLSLGRPLAADLVGRGWAVWNLEYRRVGPGAGGGGGVPATLDDVAAGIDRLAGDDLADLGLDLSTVVTLGHSAGGHLAAWAASRGRHERWPARVPVTAVVSQAGVLDLRAAHEESLGAGAVEAFLGHAPGAGAYDDAADPMRQLPLDVPLWCVHGRDDRNVPFSQSEAYVTAATAAGAQAELLPVEGDHFVVIDTGSPAWARTVEVLDGLVG